MVFLALQFAVERALQVRVEILDEHTARKHRRIRL